MPWFKVDDTFPHHAKVLAAGNAAVGLWTRAGAWSMQQLTDGFVPQHVARTLGTPGEAKRLVDVGLWLRVEGGYEFHQWDQRQPSREKVEAERHAATERQRHARERAKSQRESRRDNSVSHGPPDPTRPDPSQNYTDADASVPPRAAADEGPPPRFDEFWETYSKKVGRAKAETAYRQALKKRGVTPDLLIATAAAYITWQMTEGKHPTFTKDATTWLHGEHWRDERTPQAPAPTRVQEHLALVQQLAAEEARPAIPQIGTRR